MKDFVAHDLLLDIRQALLIWLGLVALTLVVCLALSLTGQRGRARRAERAARRARIAQARAARAARRERAASAAAEPGRTVASEPGRNAASYGASGGRPVGVARAEVPRSASVGALAAVGPVANGGSRPVGGPGHGRGDGPAETVDELCRYADEMAVAAERAAVTAQRRRQAWRQILNAQEAAWRAYERADEAARRAIEASAFPVPQNPPSAEEIRRRELYLQRAATAAYHRGELSIDELTAAMMHRDGWDPTLHPIEQDLAIRCAGRARLLASYRSLAELERAAWREAELAAAARRSLEQEAFTAALRAHRARYPVDQHESTRSPVAVRPRRSRSALRVPAGVTMQLATVPPRP